MFNRVSPRIFLITIYGILTLGNIIVEIILTRNIMILFEETKVQLKQSISFRFEMMYTKLLSLLEISYVASFYIGKDINTIVQIKTIKLISVTVWFIIAWTLGFSPEFICYFVIAAASFILLHYVRKAEYSLIYSKYNHSISVIPEVLTMHIIIQFIKAIQNSTKMFLSLAVLFYTPSGFTDYYIIFAIVKLITIYTAETLNIRETDMTKKVNVSICVTFLLDIFGVYHIINLFLMGEVLKRIVSFLMEILFVVKLFLLIYYKFLDRRFKIN